jgi:hypothetical protein
MISIKITDLLGRDLYGISQNSICDVGDEDNYTRSQPDSRGFIVWAQVNISTRRTTLSKGNIYHSPTKAELEPITLFNGHTALIRVHGAVSMVEEALPQGTSVAV